MAARLMRWRDVLKFALLPIRVTGDSDQNKQLAGHSSNEIARIGSLLQRFGAASYDYRLFI